MMLHTHALRFFSHCSWFLLPLIFFTSFVEITYAQQSKESEDARGKEIAVQFSKKMATLRSFRAALNLEIKYPQQKTPRVYTADLEARGAQYYFNGVGLEVYSDGRSRWQYVASSKEVTITTVDSTSTSPVDNPLRLFSSYQDDFRIQFRGERTEGGHTYYDLSLYPRDINQPYSQIHIALYKQTLYPAKFSYFGRDGSRYIIELKKFEPNAQVRSVFSLDTKKLKGVTVTDLRE